jgi:hypothetical protein
MAEDIAEADRLGFVRLHLMQPSRGLLAPCPIWWGVKTHGAFVPGELARVTLISARPNRR